MPEESKPDEITLKEKKELSDKITGLKEKIKQEKTSPKEKES